MTVLHVIPDDKFWTTIKALFDRVNVENRYVCIVDSVESRTKYVDPELVQIVSKDNVSSLWCRGDIDVFVFHSIPFEYYDYILSVKEKGIIIVVSWGYDIYYPQGECAPLLPIKIYKPRTLRHLRLLNKTCSISHKAKEVLKIILKRDYRIQVYSKRRLVKNNRIKQRRTLDRIDYWSTILPTEYEMLKRRVGIRARFFPLNYAYRSLVSETPTIDPSTANNIMIGNSADPSNNHFDILRVLKQKGIRNRLFIPVAYGSVEYRNALVHYVETNSIDCDIQTDLIPRDEYKKRLMNCRAAIFGHIRQQAIGNINICMLQGIKVFLYKDSIAYKFFKSMGSYVYSIEDDLCKEELSKPLTKEQNALNRKNLGWLSLDYVVPHLNQFFDNINSRANQSYKR